MEKVNEKKNKVFCLAAILMMAILPVISFGISVSAVENPTLQPTENIQSVYSDSSSLDLEFLNADPSFIKPNHAKKLSARERNCVAALGFAVLGVAVSPSWGAVATTFGPAVYQCYNG